jgi:IS605 OrfB family transposase
MKTIKLPFKTSEIELLQDLQRQYTILVKSSYKRILNKLNEKEIRLYLKTLNNVQDLDSRFLENAIIDAKSFQNENKIIFKRENFFKRFKNKVTKDIFKENKYLPIVNYGELSQKGNRKFKIDLENNKIVFKLSRYKHIDLFLPKLKINYQRELQVLQDLMEQKKICVSFKIDKNYIFISYEPIEHQIITYKNNRIMGLDLNPNNIGLSILEFKGEEFEIIYKSFIDLTKINTFKTNKKSYELIMISKQIIQVMKSFNVGNLAVEDLNMKSKDHSRGRKNNKLLNSWNRNSVVNNLIKRCRIEGIKVHLTHPAYTSIIGNLKYNYFDPINASIEVARRGYLFNKMYIKNSFYPEFKLKDQWNQWKEESGLFFEGWKDFYSYTKTLEMKYRVPIQGLVFRKECIKKIDFSIF